MYSVYSSLVSIILATVFVSAQCDENYINVSEVDCSNVNDSFQDTVRSVTCKPRYTYIVLNLKSSQTITPSSVSVPRCYGPPEEGVICAPTANGTRITQRVVSVNTLGGDSSKRQCLRVDVEEHITCERTCEIKETDCNAELQYYFKNGCKCLCKDGQAKKECERTDNKRWNEGGCRCECNAKETKCTTGLFWNDDRCKCS